ncbi:carbamoyltransferase [Pedobacter steynii]|uniref:Carbamoyltransferase n=1 Tax=Pedobacter steynii TaxID=430522 RepID=A0A1H0MJ72_9SPHI|nr:carbamoyltransferase N-terminal domain-containing protein [Pedobacter steynii]NQX43667.1 hypothetical protein [Pedobacter steynii]SDO80508.1 carbamoyltransferase [Pedobacter steynii]
MVICGIKTTHDSAIALIDNGKLIFSYEYEKLNNNNRYESMKDGIDIQLLESILSEYEYSVADIDQIVIDGWATFLDESQDYDYPAYHVPVKINGAEEVRIGFARYGMRVKDENLLERSTFNYPELNLSYSSYMHVSGHVMSAYCTSPFAAENKASFVLSWDGGMCPQLFYIDPVSKKTENLGPVFTLLGSMYEAFANAYPPFNSYAISDLSIAGKVMAYIAKGNCNHEVLKECKSLFALQEGQLSETENYTSQYIKGVTNKLLAEIVAYGEMNDIEPLDMMATFHVFIQEILIAQLALKIKQYPTLVNNLCFVGGSALNIKWNSAIRNSGLFKEMWIPPFPNDSGSAIGTACCEMIVATGRFALDWNVYSGPKISKGTIDHAWEVSECTIADLAFLLHETNEAVVFLNDRAELGPRALGNRSILAAPVKPEMKTELNRLKGRENYRPVAPICLEEDAPAIFSPGSTDPLMLYDHQVKEEWLEKIPAICHLDGSARLQTVNSTDNPIIYELLTQYKALSGVPLLCNTSANFNGKGFFPNVSSAVQWGETNMVWSDHQLFFRSESPISDFIRKKIYYSEII